MTGFIPPGQGGNEMNKQVRLESVLLFLTACHSCVLRLNTIHVQTKRLYNVATSCRQKSKNKDNILNKIYFQQLLVKDVN